MQRPASWATMAGSAPASQSIKKEDDRPTPIPTTRKRDPRSFRKRAHQHHPDEADPHGMQTRVAGEGGGGGWAGLSRSMSDGAAWQAHAKPPSAQVRLELVAYYSAHHSDAQLCKCDMYVYP